MRLSRFLLTLLFLILAVSADTIDSKNSEKLEAENHHRRVTQMIKTLLERSHYSKTELNDTLSSKIFDRYLEILDYNHRYFLASDIEEFERFRYFFDDFINTGNLNVPFTMYNRFHQRINQRIKYINSLFEGEFDFTVDEYYEPDRSEKPWAKSSAQLDSIWRKQIKHEALNLKLAGKTWEKSTEVLSKRYRNIKKRMGQSKSEDVFQLFMNSFANSFDPHTSYFSPKAKDDFNINMSRSLEGIGASLRTEDDYTKVVEIVPGGPADKDGTLQPNDRILGVAQGDDSAMVDVIGWRIDDVVQLIRGPKESIVKLQILKAGEPETSPAYELRLVRDKVRLKDQTAKSDTLNFEHNGTNYTIGVIKIPAFYFNLEGYRNKDPNYESTTRDVERLLRQFDDVDGIIIDLRRNGGGFLSEAISLTGLFIKKGPVVQVRDAIGRIKVEEDYDSKLVYDGPLAVLVDQFSASASEIFAAAIQDYGRGIILGNQTFGKGTVQNAIDLSRYFPNSNNRYGQLKLTIAKFYRVNGGSTQHVGVIPDVSLPSRFEPEEIGESSHTNALLWDQIDATRIKNQKNNSAIIKNLEALHSSRIILDPEFEDFIGKIEKNKLAREKKVFSLKEEIRKSERESSKENKKDDEDDKKEENKDLLLTESAHILSDYISIIHDH